MKVLNTTFFLVFFFAAYLSCQRELNFDGISTGVLKKDVNGNCLPVAVSGIYKVDSTLTNKNFIEVQVEVTFPGSYNIISDTVNEYFFHQTGNVNRGTSTIRLYASGKPIAAGINNFILKYGTGTCSLHITVLGQGAAVYTLGGAPNACTGAFADGTYITGSTLTTANTIIVQANVTTTGFYTIKTAAANGFSFSGGGIFTSTGLQPVLLAGTGTPLKAETTMITVPDSPGNCSLPVTVNPIGFGDAVFSFDGSPGTCTNFLVNGSYYAGIVTAVNNTVTVNVDVTRTGRYSIFTNTANGITFSASGSLSTTGKQTITLQSAGVPVRAETTAFTPNTGTVSCNFLLDVQPLPPPAVFTLSGAPNSCAPVTVNGFYIVSKPLDAANTVVIQVNVNTPGSYTITTNTVNGFSFTGIGVFPAAGIQNVILQGSGVPQSSGNYVIIPKYGASVCTFSVPVQ